MKNTLETRIGLFVALAVLAAAIILERVGSFEMFERGKHVNALFTNVQDLKVGDRVKMAGVEIGRVDSIQLTNNRVLVTMKVRPKAEVKTDSVATIKFTGLLGQNFVSIDFGTPRGEPLKNDQFIATAEQADLSAMMQKIDNVASGVENLTKSFTGFKIDTLVGPLRDFITANKDPLTATISNLQAHLRRTLLPGFARQRHAGQTHQRRHALQHRPLHRQQPARHGHRDKGDGRRRPQDRRSGQRRPGHGREAGEGRHALSGDHRVHDQPEGDPPEG